jgi:hypothetical protein
VSAVEQIVHRFGPAPAHGLRAGGDGIVSLLQTGSAGEPRN